MPPALGCVRMRNEDVEELFDFVTIGTARYYNRMTHLA